MKRLLTKLKYETLVGAALAMLTLMTFSALFNAVVVAPPVV